jgi:hypothetical protein
MTTLRRTAVLVAAVALLTAINPDTAHAYPEKGFRCYQGPTTGGSVGVAWPSLTSLSGAMEPVFFVSVLYRWQNNAWQPYRQAPAPTNPTTWYVGVSNAAGPINLGTITYPAYFYLGSAIAAEPTFPVPAGYYAVLEYYGFTSGRISQQWATLQTSNWYQPTNNLYCQVR